MNILLDMGSGNGNGNDPGYIKESINVIKAIDSGNHKVYLKYQLFNNAPPNKPLSEKSFNLAYKLGKEAGYEVTASVFDTFSLQTLTQYEVPFIKIANRPDLYYMMYYMGGKKVVVSYDSREPNPREADAVFLACISKYPALYNDYESTFSVDQLKAGISDHSIGLHLVNKYQPEWWEKHFVLERNLDNPDAGSFAITPKELAGIL